MHQSLFVGTNPRQNLSDIDSDNDDPEFDLDDFSEYGGSSDEELPTFRRDSKRRSLRKPTTNADSEWNSDVFKPIIHEFDNSNCGVTETLNLSHRPTELDIFLKQFPLSIVLRIANETNSYYRKCVREQPTSSNSHTLPWYDVTSDELYLFFGLAMLMTQVEKHMISQYWSKDKLIETPTFGKHMSRDRFKAILRYLHFSDNDSVDPSDREHKIKPIIDHLNEVFENTLVPFQNLCIDESLVLFKRKLSFKQYIPKKRHRFGIKLFLLCDAETGYILKIIVYVGKATRVGSFADGQLGISGDIVIELLQNYLGYGHTLFVDNWYTSLNLFEYLHSRKTNCCGTVKQNRRGLEKRPKKLKAGEVIAKYKGNVNYLSWMDKKLVNMLSTFHDDQQIPTSKISYATGEPVIKPKAIVAYNADMGAIDKSDMMLSYVECVRKSLKWYRKLFFHLLDLSLLNSYYVWEVVTGEKPGLPKFQLELCRQILEKFGEVSNAENMPNLNHNISGRFQGSHFPGYITDERNKNPVRRCVICSKKKLRKETRFLCKTCNVALCVVPCFEIYHTQD